MLSRPEGKIKKSLNCDYIGFRIPDLWIAGYGIDAAQDFRELPFIVVVNVAYYRQRALHASRGLHGAGNMTE
jgi:hypoxanthine-guanine phosphoribosyltransferase